jgi:hypothetical protein
MAVTQKVGQMAPVGLLQKAGRHGQTSAIKRATCQTDSSEFTKYGFHRLHEFLYFVKRSFTLLSNPVGNRHLGNRRESPPQESSPNIRRRHLAAPQLVFSSASPGSQSGKRFPFYPVFSQPHKPRTALVSPLISNFFAPYTFSQTDSHSLPSHRSVLR